MFFKQKHSNAFEESELELPNFGAKKLKLDRESTEIT